MNERNFVCNECPQAYNTASDLAQHRRIHEKHQDPYSCPECSLQFQFLSQFNAHLRTHRQNIIHECTICNKRFARPKYLAAHMRDIHQEIDCAECGETFRKRSDFDRHVNTVHLKLIQHGPTVACDICGEAVEKIKHQQHLKTAHNIVKEIKCKICFMLFKMPSYLKSHHDAVHLGIKNHECRECGKKFSKMSGMKKHRVQVHLKIKDFKCECGKEFHDKYRMRKHMRVHLKAATTVKLKKRFYCDCCADGKGFAKKSHIVQHLKKQFQNKPTKTLETVVVKIETDEGLNDDNDWDPGSVPSCSKNERFSDNDDWNFGIQEEPLREIKQEKPTSKSIVVKESLEAEIESKHSAKENPVLKLKCNLCSQMFGDDNSFKCHLITAHDLNKLKCTLCTQTFENKDEFKTHFLAVHAFSQNDTKGREKHKTEVEPKQSRRNLKGEGEKDESASCDICGKSFWNRKYLSTHISGVHRRGEKAFECDVCLKKFTYKMTRDRHFKKQHSGNQT